MKKYPFLLLAIFGLLIEFSAGAEEKTTYRSELDIVYGTVEGRELKLNAFLPADAIKPVPAIVEIHGGWWYGGDSAKKVEDVGGHRVFMHRGLAIFSIQYRLGQAGGFPENIRDCRNAIRFIRQNAKRFNIDAELIDVTGFSAGGHLSAMLARVPEDFADGGPLPGLEGVSARVSGSFSHNLPTDLARFWNQGPDDTVTYADGTVTFRPVDAQIRCDSHPRLRILFHGITPDTEEHRALYDQMCPIGHIRKNIPPILICDGEKDPVVPGLHCKALYAALKAVGADATYWMSANGGHGFPSGEGFTKVLDGFIERTLISNSKSEAHSAGQEAPNRR
ncbi:MAG: alpha/beta hydrolase [Opitutus sp.]|nr:alpha/beta hydrolase [Opitutus sp.]